MSADNSGWIDRPYGRKKLLAEEGKLSHQLVLIEPGRNTGRGANPDLLDEFGLVGHPGIFYEHIEHEGFAVQSNRQGSSHDAADTSDLPELSNIAASSPSLKYVARSLEKSENPREFLYSSGSAFYSVGTDEQKFGYYHTLENVAGATIQLRLRVMKI
jgi:hypothetical protein